MVNLFSQEGQYTAIPNDENLRTIIGDYYRHPKFNKDLVDEVKFTLPYMDVFGAGKKIHVLFRFTSSIVQCKYVINEPSDNQPF